MEVEDAKRLVRDAAATRIFNGVVSLERKSYNDTSSPSTPPYAMLKLEKKMFFAGWGEGLGMYGCEESSTNANGSQDFCP